MKVAGATVRSCQEGGMEAGRQPGGKWWAGEARQGVETGKTRIRLQESE